MLWTHAYDTANILALSYAAVERTAAPTPPRQFRFHPTANILYFIASDASVPLTDAPPSTLYAVSLPSSAPESATEAIPKLPWLPMLPAPPSALTPAEDAAQPPPSKELALLRERMRTVAHGLTDYVLHAASRMLLLPLAGALHLAPLPSADAPLQRLTS
eukprot:IDg13275t1